MVGAAFVEEADEFWPSPVGRYPLVTPDDFSEPLDSSFRDFHPAAPCAPVKPARCSEWKSHTNVR